jgi:hypothetical protein
MHIIIAVAAGVALLYFWLLGHWFARVLVFLLCLGVGLILADLPALIFLGVVGWFGGGIPLYVRRHQARKLQKAIARSFEPPPGGWNYGPLTRR